MKPKYPPPPPPETVDDSPDLPDMTASWWSQLFFLWVQPIMALGATRELTAEDMYKLGHDRDAGVLSKKLLQSFQRRWDQADEYNAKLEAGEIPVPRKLKIKWALGAGEGKTRQEKEKEWREKSGKKQPSLTWALSDVFGLYFWLSGLIKVSFKSRCGRREADIYLFAPGCRRYSFDMYVSPDQTAHPLLCRILLFPAVWNTCTECWPRNRNGYWTVLPLGPILFIYQPLFPAFVWGWCLGEKRTNFGSV